MRSFVDYPAPRMRNPTVLYVGNCVVHSRIQRCALVHGRQHNIFAFVQYRRYRTNNRRSAGPEKLEYLKRLKETIT